LYTNTIGNINIGNSNGNLNIAGNVISTLANPLTSNIVVKTRTTQYNTSISLGNLSAMVFANGSGYSIYIKPTNGVSNTYFVSAYCIYNNGSLGLAVNASISTSTFTVIEGSVATTASSSGFGAQQVAYVFDNTTLYYYRITYMVISTTTPPANTMLTMELL